MESNYFIEMLKSMNLRISLSSLIQNPLKTAFQEVLNLLFTIP
jgi:hypothetical protein